MPFYEWTREDPFRDNRNDRLVSEGEVVELPKNVADPAYGFRRVEAEESHSEPDPETSETEPDAEAETFRCGVNDCSREVDSPEDTCWQHPE